MNVKSQNIRVPLILEIDTACLSFCSRFQNLDIQQTVSWETAYLRRKSFISSSKVFLKLSEIKLSESQMDDEQMIRLEWLIWHLWSDEVPSAWNSHKCTHRCIKHAVSPHCYMVELTITPSCACDLMEIEQDVTWLWQYGNQLNNHIYGLVFQLSCEILDTVCLTICQVVSLANMSFFGMKRKWTWLLSNPDCRFSSDWEGSSEMKLQVYWMWARWKFLSPKCHFWRDVDRLNRHPINRQNSQCFMVSYSWFIHIIIFFPHTVLLFITDYSCDVLI